MKRRAWGVKFKQELLHAPRPISMTPETCPNCGAAVPPRAKCCPGCGSDEATGWSDRAHSSRLDLPDEEFDYDEFVKDEFGPQREKPPGVRWLWLIVVLVLIGGLLAWYWP